MKYCVAIIMYNPTNANIKNINNYIELFDNIFILDNSTDRKYSEKIIKQLNGKCTYISMMGNKGMSEALNKAFSKAYELKYDFILTMDQDSCYDEENMKNMMTIIESSRDDRIAIFAANFRKTYYNGKEKKYGKFRVAGKEIKEEKMCITSGSWVKVTAVKKILPLRNYFIGFVDNDISTSLIENGYKLVTVGSSRFDQQVGKNVSNTYINRKFRVIKHDKIRYYYMSRNIRFYRDSHPKTNLFYYYYLWWIRIMLNILLFEEKKIEKLKYCYIGYKDYKYGSLGKYNN